MSIYLDLVRFCAALCVFLGHASGQRFSGGYLWHFDELRHDAVTVFFVLSGFVIAHVTNTSEQTPREFFINRAARIFSVAIPALALTYALDAVGMPAAPKA
ncbi:MAG: acyltransferase family protein, partial [Terriglobia bacterium]